MKLRMIPRNRLQWVLAAMLVLAGFALPAAGQTVTLEATGDIHNLAYNAAPRLKVFEKVFSAMGVELVWQGTGPGEEKITGQYQGSLEAIARFLLQSVNHAVAYDASGATARMRRVTIIGTAEPPHGGKFVIVAPLPGAAAPALEAVPNAAMAGRSGRVEIALADGSRLVFGGSSAGGLAEAMTGVARLNTDENRWEPAGHLAEAALALTACALADGTVLLTGTRPGEAGSLSGKTAIAQIHTPATGQSQLLNAAPIFARDRPGMAVTLKDGRCLITGGGGFQPELFDPQSGSFTALDPPAGLENPRADPNAMSLLPDGTVLIVGVPPVVFHPSRNKFEPVPQ